MRGPATWRRIAYLGCTAALAGGGWGIAVRLVGWRAGDAALGLGAAWTVQAVAFWKLAGRLWRGEDVVATWAGGIAARLAGLAVLWVSGRVAGRGGPDLVGSYALALLAFLLAEAAWLAVPFRALRERGGGERRTRA